VIADVAARRPYLLSGVWQLVLLWCLSTLRSMQPMRDWVSPRRAPINQYRWEECYGGRGYWNLEFYLERILTLPPERRIHPTAVQKADALPDESGAPFSSPVLTGGNVKMRPFAYLIGLLVRHYFF